MTSAQLVKQEEVLYNINFKIVMMERKIDRAKGVRSHTETEELNRSIEKLTKELDRVNSEHAMLITQFKKAEHHLTRAGRQNTHLLKQQGICYPSYQTYQSRRVIR